MKGKLYLNSELVEAEINIPLSFISNQLNDLNDKRAGMSGSIILEKNEIFHEDADIWEDEIDCDYIMGGIKLVSNGKARLLKFTKDEVHLKIYFGALLLSELLKDLNINELIDETLDITWNLSNIIRSCSVNDVFFMFANTDIIGEDNFMTSNKVNAERLIPAIKVRKIIELIEDETDVTFTGDFATDLLINNMCMPLISNKNIDIRKIEVIKDEPVVYTLLTKKDHPSIEIIDERWDLFDEVDGDGTLTGGSEIKVNAEGNYDIEVNMNLNYRIFSYFQNSYESNGLTISNISYQLHRIRGVADTELVRWETGTLTGLQTSMSFTNNNINIIAKNINLLTTDKIKLKIQGYVIIDCGIVLSDRIGYFQHFSYGNIKMNKTAIQYNGEFQSTQLLPELTAIDFIKSLIQKKGFMLEFDDLNEQYELNYFKHLYNNILVADDWSDVFVDYEITDIYGVFGRNNKFLYSNDKDVEADYGGYSVLVDKQILPPETIILQDKTAGTKQELFEEFSNDFEICRIPIISEKKIEWEKLNPRFLLFERKTTEAITITDGASDVVVTSVNRVWFQNGQNYNLDYKFLVDNYYSDYVAMFDRFRKYTIKAQLHSSDCIRDQLRPVYIKQLNAYFFVEKINYVSDTQLSTIELIRL
jgi:hypothetical protein